MLTIFGNLRINSASRLQHMKDSFLSFKDISDDWVINIRGSFRDEAIEFLKENLGDKLTLFELLDEKRGWINNALEMFSSIKHDYVLVWNEDHLNIAPQESYKNIIREMSEKKAQYMLFTWWIFGKARKVFDDLEHEIDLEKYDNIDVVNLTKKNWSKIRRTGYPYFILSLAGIYHKNLWHRLLIQDKRKLPMFFTRMTFKFFAFVSLFKLKFNHKKWIHIVSRLVFYKLGRYSKETPFNLERPPIRTDMLPVRIALSKQELFACIDDDLDTPGYSLIGRGLYTDQNNTNSIVKNVTTILKEIDSVLKNTDEQQVNNLINMITGARNIVAVGAGRVGLATKGFVMRLGHLGLNAYLVGDTTLPAMGEHDVLLVSSGSGETKTILDLVHIAKRNGAKIVLVTGNKDSSMGRLADVIVEIHAPSKTKKVEGLQSVQPMTTLNEQCLAVFYDAVVLRLMEELKEEHDTMWERHSNLE
jgi:6-phospho-3-hexuloisomerase